MIEKEPNFGGEEFDKWEKFWLKEKTDPKFEDFFQKRDNFREDKTREIFINKLLEKEIFKKDQIGRNRELGANDFARIRFNVLKEAGIGVAGKGFEVCGRTIDSIVDLMRNYPQTQEGGAIRYLLTGGLAVQAITGFSRLHHDTDLVICDGADGWWAGLLTDNVTPNKYWADMSFSSGFLEETRWTATFKAGGGEYTVLTVHPAILLVQKLSNAWGRQPREKDLADAQALVTLWRKLGRPQYWVNLAQKALDALPTQSEKIITRMRLKDADFLGQSVI